MKILFLILIMLMLNACQTVQNSEQNIELKSVVFVTEDKPESELKSRIKEYWSNFLERKWDKNYLMESPSNRKKFNSKAYSIYFNGGWPSDKVEIININPISENNYWVTVKISMNHLVTGEKKRVGKTEKWIKVNGIWYHHLEDPLIPLQSFN